MALHLLQLLSQGAHVVPLGKVPGGHALRQFPLKMKYPLVQLMHRVPEHSAQVDEQPLQKPLLSVEVPMQERQLPLDGPLQVRQEESHLLQRAPLK